MMVAYRPSIVRCVIFAAFVHIAAHFWVTRVLLKRSDLRRAVVSLPSAAVVNVFRLSSHFLSDERMISKKQKNIAGYPVGKGPWSYPCEKRPHPAETGSRDRAKH